MVRRHADHTFTEVRLVSHAGVGRRPRALDEEKKLVAMFNYLWSSKKVFVLAERLYIALEYGLWDNVGVARNKRSNPYSAELGARDEVHCGHNPSLRARRVRNFRVVVNDDGTHQTSWEEILRIKAE